MWFISLIDLVTDEYFMIHQEIEQAKVELADMGVTIEDDGEGSSDMV